MIVLFVFAHTAMLKQGREALGSEKLVHKKMVNN